MKRNEGGIDRALRIIFGLALLVLGIFAIKSVALIVVFIVIGAILTITGLTGFCLLYVPLGINTGSKPGKDEPKQTAA